MTINTENSKGKKLIEFLKKEEKKNYICCKVNGRIRPLDYMIENNNKTTIEYLDLKDPESARIYQSSLIYVVSMAIRLIHPELEIRFFYNVSRTVFCKVMFPEKFKIDMDFVDKIREKTEELIQADIPFERQKITIRQAMDLYEAQGLNDKIEALKNLQNKFTHTYKASYEGKDYYDYLFGYFVPSSGYLKKYNIRIFNPGFVIQVPRAECNGEIPEFENEIKFAESLQNNSHWAEENHLDSLPEINDFIRKYGTLALINTCETRFNNTMSDLGKILTDEDKRIRLICIAGPSSSGKTSFSNRLLFELMSRGKRPIRISLDDFYIPRAELTPGTDIEAVEAIDIKLFSETMNRLIRGYEAQLPSYDFRTGLRSFREPVSLSDDQPIIIEGIHALNRKLTADISDFTKYKIYLAPQPQINVDNHTPISMTDIRLIRRIMRDVRTRETSPEDTIAMWANVRSGEFKYIYPTQENADFVFDTFMAYELSMMKNIAYPMLDEIKSDSPYYMTACRLKAMLRSFLAIEAEDIPCNSLMREFIGGTSFKDAR